MDYRDRFDYKEQLNSPVKVWKNATFDYHNPDIKPLFYEGPKYHGKETRVFAWVGLPKNASKAHPVPGIVLVHGGGGTALAHWVELWNNLGFAAISMDTCGGVPCWDTGLSYRTCWPRHKHSGPKGWGNVNDMLEEPREQWLYHAAAAVIRGTNLLCSLPEVDSNKIGITGISWGGYLTNIACALDTRYKFAIPVYGCAFCDVEESALVPNTDPELWKQWFKQWDPQYGLKYIKTPMLFVQDAEDFAFTLTSWQRTLDTIKAPVYSSLRFNYVHGHSTCYSSKTIPVFANAMLEGKALPQFNRISMAGNVVTAEVNMQGRNIAKCILAATRATGPFVDRTWRDYAAQSQDNGILTAEVPKSASACFFMVIDEQGCTWSSPVQFIR